ncbi:MAG: lytic polysaccharide monooxygenase [Plesiomonas sp.]|uniref:lytic polysaccharide monooxygenase n=1 Tax=Plesiomonas sp. TaxID=2486279 RepID=UPI003F3BE7A5
MHKGTAFSTLSLALLLATPSLTFAHGYMEFPAARQEFCDKDGGYWDSQNGSTIPNLACRQAYLQSSWYPFVQKPEFSKLVSNYNDLNAVKAAIPDGRLCSAGDDKKAGIDQPSPDWKKTAIDLSKGGKTTLRFMAATPHNPSFWQIFLTKQGFDSATQKLNWADLELIASFNDLPVTVIDGKKYYQMDVQLPTGRTGDAVLYTRWQRVDPAGEGFYNCSDLSFGGGSAVVAPWLNKGSFIKAGQDAKSGETVWFRIFDASGKEVVTETLTLTSSNETESVWGQQLATKVNSTYASIVQVGVLDNTDKVIYSSGDLYTNQIFVKNKDYTYQLDIRAANTAPVVTAPASVSVASGQSVSFDVSATDANGDKLTFSASAGTVVSTTNKATITYQAPVSAQDQSVTINVTVSDGVNKVVQPVIVNIKGTGTPLPTTPKAWDVSSIYQANDLVSYNGVQYKAQWWTKGETPGSSSVWLKVTTDSGSTTGPAAWSADIAYTTGQTVTYQNSSYKAKWWTKGEIPTTSAAWQKL